MNDKEFLFLLEKIRRNKGIDFSLYREGTLRRRLDSRLRTAGCAGYLEYVSCLNRDPAEYDRLIEALTINVTEFFRNPETYLAIRQKVLPEIIRHKTERASQSIRAWCAGASYGEEAYSLAIVFLQLLKDRKADCAVRILGTDIDPDCVAKAKTGLYEPDHLRNAGKHILNTYFTREGGGYRIGDAARQLTEFKAHNMLADKPLGRYDLILCRNVIIYLTKPLQEFVYNLFAKCLNPGGFLVLGKVETLWGCSQGFFETIDRKERIYRKI